MMTPFEVYLESELNIEWQRFANEWLFKWHGMTYEGGVTDVDDFRGGRIRYRGIKFGRQQQELFWQSIDRYLIQKVHEIFRRWDTETSRYSAATRQASIEGIERHLRAFVQNIIQHSLKTDGALRSMGNVTHIDSSVDMSRAHAEIVRLAHAHRALLDEQVREMDETSVKTELRMNVTWDVFVSHASEDKDDFVRPLASRLQAHGLKVWFDEFTLTVGDSLRRSIDRGLAASRFGIVVISPDFMRKEWPQRELDGLVAREIAGVKVILPVWHKITADQIRAYSPTLADRLAASSERGLDHVITELLLAIGTTDSIAEDRAPMQPAYYESGTTFEELPTGHLFRFYNRSESVIGLKGVFNYGDLGQAALVLTPTRAGLRPGDLLSGHDVGPVIELNGVKIIPSTKPGSVTQGAGNFAQPGEIELRGHHLIFVSTIQGDSSLMRVNLSPEKLDLPIARRSKFIQNGHSFGQIGTELRRYTHTVMMTGIRTV
jgi:hypothetical protein